MIDLELVLELLDQLRAEVISGLESPSNPTEFGFGTLHGMLAALESMRQRLDSLVEDRSGGNS